MSENGTELSRSVSSTLIRLQKSSALAARGRETIRIINKERDNEERKRAKIASLANLVSSCQRCPLLAINRTNTVIGDGCLDADIMFITEPPSHDDDRHGKPCMGRRGVLLNNILTASRLSREEIYICSTICCHPPKDRHPSAEESANCREFVDRQIAIVQPKYIMCWGMIAARNVLDTELPMSKLRGEFHRYGNAKVLCTWPLGYLMRNPSHKKETWHDMKLLRRDMGVDLP